MALLIFIQESLEGPLYAVDMVVKNNNNIYMKTVHQILPSILIQPYSLRLCIQIFMIHRITDL